MSDPNGFYSSSKNLNSDIYPSSDSSHIPLKHLEICLKYHINECFRNKLTNLIEEEEFKLPISQFNSLFVRENTTLTGSSENFNFNCEYINLIRRLESLDLNKCKIYRLYPLLRKILIITEAYLVHTFKKQLNDSVYLKISKLLAEDDLFCCKLDSFYRDNNVVIPKQYIVKRFDFNTFAFDICLKSLELVSKLISNLYSQYNGFTGNEPEVLETFIIFNFLQKLVGASLIFLIVSETNNDTTDTTISASAKTEQPNLDKFFSNSPTKIDRISKLTISVFNISKLNENNTYIKQWSLKFLLPVWNLLSIGLSFITDFGANYCRLTEILVVSLSNLTPQLVNDIQKVLKTLDQCLGIYNNKLCKLNELVRDYLSSYYNQNMNAISLKKTKSPKIGSQSPANSSSRDLTTYFQRKNLEKCMVEYAQISGLFLKFYLEVIEHTKDSNENRDFYGLLHSLSKLFSDMTILILFTDGLEYVAKRNLSLDTLNSLKQTIENTWELSVSVVKKLPFDIVNALFYYTGSKFNNINVLGQIYIFNSIQHTGLSRTHYLKYIKMLDHIIKNSKETLTNPIFFENAKITSKQLHKKYLSVHFSHVCKLFIHEMGSEDTVEHGIMSLFVSWCNSINVYQNLLARNICIFITRLCNSKPKYLEVSKYLMDLVLGMCFFAGFDSSLGFSLSKSGTLTIKPMKVPYPGMYPNDTQTCKEISNLYKLKPNQANAFEYVRLLSDSPILEWLLENVALTYTCVFVKEVKELSKNIHTETKCFCAICGFKCYFQTSHLKQCRCLDSMIVNRNPSLAHYLEFVNCLSSTMPLRPEGKVKTLSEFFFTTLNGVLSQLVTILVESKDKGDLKAKFSLFRVAVKLTKGLVNGRSFNLNSKTCSYLIKLFSLLGSSQICRIGTTSDYIRQISETLRILHSVLTKTHNDQLFDLHKGLLHALVGKIQRFPTSLSMLEFYTKNEGALGKRYAGVVEMIMRNSKDLNSCTLRVVYNYHSWKMCLNNGLDKEIKELFDKKLVTTAEGKWELRTFINLLFILSRQVKEVPLKLNGKEASSF